MVALLFNHIYFCKISITLFTKLCFVYFVYKRVKAPKQTQSSDAIRGTIKNLINLILQGSSNLVLEVHCPV